MLSRYYTVKYTLTVIIFEREPYTSRHLDYWCIILPVFLPPVCLSSQAAQLVPSSLRLLALPLVPAHPGKAAKLQNSLITLNTSNLQASLLFNSSYLLAKHSRQTNGTLNVDQKRAWRERWHSLCRSGTHKVFQVDFIWLRDRQLIEIAWKFKTWKKGSHKPPWILVNIRRSSSRRIPLPNQIIRTIITQRELRYSLPKEVMNRLNVAMQTEHFPKPRKKGKISLKPCRLSVPLSPGHRESPLENKKGDKGEK